MSQLNKLTSFEESYPGSSITGAILLVIKASSKEEACLRAGEIDAFISDSQGHTVAADSTGLVSCDAIETAPGEFVISGIASAPLVSPYIVMVEAKREYRTCSDK